MMKNKHKIIATKLDDLNIRYVTQFPLGNCVYDFCLSAQRLLIEINAPCTHSTSANPLGPRKNPNYYLNKSKLAWEHGYQCLHIFDWDNLTKILNGLTYNKTIYHQDCTVIELSPDESDDFSKKYCLYEIHPTDTICLGLKKGKKIVQMIRFKLVDIFVRRWAILSIDTRFNFNVHRGYQKILQHFIDNFHPQTIRTSVDLSKSDGGIVRSLGFNLIKTEEPTIIWSKGLQAISEPLIRSILEPEEHRIITPMMLHSKYLPIYNCGYGIYELVIQ